MASQFGIDEMTLRLTLYRGFLVVSDRASKSQLEHVLTSALPADAIEDLDQHEICLTQITSGPPNPVAMRDMER